VLITFKFRSVKYCISHGKLAAIKCKTQKSQWINSTEAYFTHCYNVNCVSWEGWQAMPRSLTVSQEPLVQVETTFLSPLWPHLWPGSCGLVYDRHVAHLVIVFKNLLFSFFLLSITWSKWRGPKQSFEP
jgi:hypothetical protein